MFYKILKILYTNYTNQYNCKKKLDQKDKTFAYKILRILYKKYDNIYKQAGAELGQAQL